MRFSWPLSMRPLVRNVAQIWFTRFWNSWMSHDHALKVLSRFSVFSSSFLVAVPLCFVFPFCVSFIFSVSLVFSFSFLICFARQHHHLVFFLLLVMWHELSTLTWHWSPPPTAGSWSSQLRCYSSWGLPYILQFQVSGHSMWLSAVVQTLLGLFILSKSVYASVEFPAFLSADMFARSDLL